MHFKVVLTFDSIDDNLKKRKHAVLSWGTHKFAVQGGFNFSSLEDILKCHETYRTLRSRVGVVLKKR